MRYHPRTHGETITQQRCRHHISVADQQPEESWLQPGERVHAEIQAHAWRYLAIDVPYEHRTILFGGPIGWICSGIASASAIGNRRTRQAAERRAAPQWRHLGHLPIIVTNRRLMVWHEAAWWPVWLDVIDSVGRRGDFVVLNFHSDPAYGLRTAIAEELELLIRDSERSQGVATERSCAHAR